MTLLDLALTFVAAAAAVSLILWGLELVGWLDDRRQ